MTLIVHTQSSDTAHWRSLRNRRFWLLSIKKSNEHTIPYAHIHAYILPLLTVAVNPDWVIQPAWSRLTLNSLTQPPWHLSSKIDPVPSLCKSTSQSAHQTGRVESILFHAQSTNTTRKYSAINTGNCSVRHVFIADRQPHSTVYRRWPETTWAFPLFLCGTVC